MTADPDPPRRGRWGWGNAGLLLGLSIAVTLATTYGLSSRTTFSIVARTETLTIRAACGARNQWDLPPGYVYGASTIDRSEPTAQEAQPITVVFGEGVLARVTLQSSGRLVVGLRPVGTSQLGAVTASVGGLDRPRDEAGYDYVSLLPSELSGPGRGADRSVSRMPVTLRLAGRVVLGDAVPEGGGWRDSSNPILSGGQILAYDRAWITGERLTLLTERIDPGSVIDTHPELSRKDMGRLTIDIAADGSGPQGLVCPAHRTPWAAVGYLRDHQDGGMEVVLYRVGPSIGLAPLGGPGLEIGLTWWSRFAASSVVQTSAAALAFCFLLFQILCAADGWSLLASLRRSLTRRRKPQR